MTDAYRLRKAAGWLEWEASHMQVGDFPSLQNERQRKHDTAALLRAVADMNPASQALTLDLMPVELAVLDAADALAAIILGGVE